MKNNIHEHYDQLKVNERDFVDSIIWDLMKESKTRMIPIQLKNDDDCEHFADAFAKFIIQSRKD